MSGISLVINIPERQVCLNKVDNSLIKRMKIVKLDLSPCLVPILLEKNSVIPIGVLTHEFKLEYIHFNTRKKFPYKPIFWSELNSLEWSILSYAFLNNKNDRPFLILLSIFVS